MLGALRILGVLGEATRLGIVAVAAEGLLDASFSATGDLPQPSVQEVCKQPATRSVGAAASRSPSACCQPG